MKHGPNERGSVASVGQMTVVAFKSSVPIPMSELTREGPDLFAERVAQLRRAMDRAECRRGGLDPNLLPARA